MAEFMEEIEERASVCALGIKEENVGVSLPYANESLLQEFSVVIPDELPVDMQPLIPELPTPQLPIPTPNHLSSPSSSDVVEIRGQSVSPPLVIYISSDSEVDEEESEEEEDLEQAAPEKDESSLGPSHRSGPSRHVKSDKDD
ncbi:hypothetical protein ACFX2C_019296 [Malus domestica]